MTREGTADLLLVAAPFAGFIINVFGQFVLTRLMRLRLLSSIFIAFIAGGIVCFAALAIALFIHAQPMLDKLALSASVLLVYSAAGFVSFAVINLGETSLRIRMMRLILENPDGLNAAEILTRYNDALTLSVRLRRMVDNRQVTVSGEALYPRPSALILAVGGIWFLKWLIYGGRESQLLHDWAKDLIQRLLKR
jgi:hypothetical protein